MEREQNGDIDSDIPNGLTEQSADGEPILKKYAGAVHIGADLTLYQRRAFNVLLFWAMPRMPQTTRHAIDLEALAWGMGLDRASQRMRRLVENLDKMMEARVVWNLLDENGDLEEWESATLLPYVKLNRRDRKVTYEFTKAFQERVYNPSEYAEIALRVQRVFRSEHALALYENTRRFLVQGETPWIPIETFRTLMGVNTKAYYEEFKYLNGRLIKPAMQQVNTCSDIQLELKTKRIKRVVAELKFKVSENPQMSLFTESLQQEPNTFVSEDADRLILRLSGYRIVGKRAEQLIATHTEDEILAALEAADAWMEEKEKRRESIANPAGVAYKAIVEGWRKPDQQSIDSCETSLQTRSQDKAEAASKRCEALRIEFRRTWYRQYIDRLCKDELTALKLGFEEALATQDSDQIILKRFQKQGLTGMVLGAFQHHLSQQGIEPPEAEYEAYLKMQGVLLES